LAVLGTSPSPVDVVPSWVVHHLLEEHQPTLSVADIRKARRGLLRQDAWLVPDPENGLCLVRVIYPLDHEESGEHLPPAVSRLCARNAEVETGRLFETQSLSTTIAKRLPTLVDGMVPDGVDQVV